MRRVDHEVLEALWGASRDLRADAKRMRARVLENKRQSEEIRARIAIGLGQARAEEPADGALAKS